MLVNMETRQHADAIKSLRCCIEAHITSLFLRDGGARCIMRLNATSGNFGWHTFAWQRTPDAKYACLIVLRWQARGERNRAHARTHLKGFLSPDFFSRLQLHIACFSLQRVMNPVEDGFGYNMRSQIRLVKKRYFF